MAHLRAGGAANHSAISSSVRRQPRHQPVRGSIRHTPLHGLGGSLAISATKHEGSVAATGGPRSRPRFRRATLLAQVQTPRNFVAFCRNAP
jgi:hypothetical protein